jgi:hypothetical protein
LNFRTRRVAVCRIALHQLTVASVDIAFESLRIDILFAARQVIQRKRSKDAAEFATRR